MSIGGYPIYSINNSIAWAKEQGYKIWHWHTGGDAVDSSLEPLTQEFWLQKREARLAHGLCLPQSDLRYGGDLLILVTQRLDQAIQKGFGGLTARQRTDVYSLILKISYMHVTVISAKAPKQRMEFFQKCEKSFADLMPKQNAKGEYYRAAASSKDLELLQLDQEGKIVCPACRRNLLFDDGLWVMEKRMGEGNTLIVSAICEYCGALSEIRLEETNSRYPEFMAQMGIQQFPANGG